MELRHLIHFVTVAEERNFTRAAQRLHIVQSGLSSSIRSLERELGAELFRRSTQPIELTTAGRAFLGHARRTLSAAEAARAAVEDLSHLLTGTLLIGTMQWMQSIGLSSWIQAFHQAHPGVEVRLHQSGSQRLVEQVRRCELDLAFVSLPQQPPPGLALTHLLTERLVLACPSGHPFANRDAVTIRELADERFLDFHPEWGIRPLVDRAFASEDVQRRSVCEANDISLVLDMVQHGLGVAVVPESAVEHHHPDVAVVPMGGTPLLRDIDLVVPTGGPHSPAARRFLEFGPEAVRRAALGDHR
ncbi:LysR family transcriptional regulator [Streptomyces sp. NPDC046805]|uniref:LysR family transcriptional regulator n=1 Tax=Streptomyces sp. NPDC046805 TaxID=3155134 RepID=UPI0033D30E97